MSNEKTAEMKIEKGNITKWKCEHNTTPLGDTGDYMEDAWITNGNIRLFAEVMVELDELQEICDKLNTRTRVSSEGERKPDYDMVAFCKNIIDALNSKDSKLFDELNDGNGNVSPYKLVAKYLPPPAEKQPAPMVEMSDEEIKDFEKSNPRKFIGSHYETWLWGVNDTIDYLRSKLEGK